MVEYEIYLLTNQMQKHIEGVIDSIFVKMASGHKEFIKKFTIYLADTIGCKLNFTNLNVNDFFTQISQNDSRDIISIMYLMLPYIDDANNYHLFKQITRLEDITCKKKSSSVYSNNYVISNYQFSRYIEYNTDKKYLFEMNNYERITKQNGYYEYKYSIVDLEISFKLVLKTIDQIISRLYVNWINIIPITLSDYRESDKYKQTFFWDDMQKKFMCTNLFNSTTYPFDFWNLDLDSDLRAYGGIGAGDVFNTIYVFLFKEIYNSGVKWLLYEKKEQDAINTQPTIYIELLDQILSIDNFYFNKIYDTIDSKQRKLSEDTWKKLINQVILNPNSKYSNFLKLVVLKFDLKYCDKELAQEYNYDYTSLYENKQLKVKNAKLIDDDNDDLEKDDNYNVYDLRKLNPGEELYSEYINKLKQFEVIPFGVIYEFLVEQIQKFKLTWYGKRILKQTENKITIDKEVKFNPKDNYVIINGIKYFPTYKNIYNFAKSIAIKLSNSGSNLVDARSLNSEQKTLFISILNRQTSTNFNITQVLKKTYGSNLPTQTIRQLQNFIADYFMTNLKDLVFTTWIQLGLLNKFVTDPSITDEKLLGDSETSRKVNIKKKLEKKFSSQEIKSNLLDTYYYLTLDKYSNLEIYDSKTDRQIDWFELTFIENEPWYYSFAMNWVSQINFLHHFISNRVMFVTGATGQGKSTEVPKLLYYALKAVNLNLSGRVISTQPTIIPTIKNAKIIAKNLGVPVEINGFNTSNPYLQYSTQDKKHLISGSQTYIKEVTDRTLFEEIIQSPFLKKKGKTKKEFTDENLYDIVIIDEAHMHNINMDLILTFMKNVVNINNQIKLIITSATMNDDEFIYRRYYKILDDNYGYPICPTIAKLEYSPNYLNGVDEEYYLLDKITVDRRYHISPPGLTTKYKVTDKYLEIDTSNYEEAEVEGLKILTDIMAKNSTGDVLFFTTTEPAINSLIKRINDTSPTHVIALPLYGALKNKPGDWFDKIENIDKNLKSFTYSKTQLLDVIDGIVPNPSKVSAGTYTMAVIVATNIVEASVTIPTLRFVIDTGYFNSVVFDDDIDDVAQSIDPIPEASRLQRRGRVGRVAPGTVYYTYAKEARAHIKPRYGIVTADVTYDLFKIMYSDTSKNTSPIYNVDYHPIKWNLAKKDTPTLTWEKYIDLETNPDIRKLYLNQYAPLEVNSIVNPFDNTPIDIKEPYSDGYTIRELMDTQGSFYIIHPDEYKIRRNVITGKISNIDTEINVRLSEYNSPKLIKSLERLAAIKYIYIEKEIRNFQTDYKYFKKLPYYIIIDEILRDENKSIGFLLKNFKEDDVIKIFKTILVAHCYNCVDSTIKILSLIYSIGSYKNFVAKQKSNPKFNDYDNFISMWEDPQSELFSFLKIMNFFVQLKQSNDTHRKKISSSKLETSFSIFGDLLKKYGNKIFLKKTVRELETKSIDKTDIVNFMYYTNNNYNSKKRYDDYSKQNSVKNKKQVVANYSEYCNKFYINSNGILSALRMYSTLSEIFKKETHKENISKFITSYPVIKSLDHKENILKCFLEGYLGNLCIYTSDKKIINLTTEVQVKPPKLALTNLFKSPIFFCLKGRDELFGLTKISRELVEQVFPINIITSNQKFIDEEPPNISNISLKYLFNPPSSKLINVFINNQMQKVQVKRYRLRIKS